MANIARVTQAVVEVLDLQNGTAKVTQAVVEYLVNVGVSCNAPPAGQLGVAYSHAFLAGGGQAPLTFAISAGALPPGLALDPATGIVSGIPAALGLYNFTVQVTDALGAVNTVVCSIFIMLKPSTVNILLYGWKLYPVETCDAEAVPAGDIPSVDRAV